MGGQTNMEKERTAARSVLEGKRVLAVDDEQDVLAIIKDEIRSAAISCVVDTAVSYRDAIALMASWTYDLAIFDIMGVRGFELLESAVDRPNPIPVVMLTARALSPEALRESIRKGARAYLPKEHLGAIVPFLEDVLTNEYGPVWKRMLKQIEGIFSEGWGPYWRNPDAEFWKDFEVKTESEQK
jgi:CheY-like chemotaxis protein